MRKFYANISNLSRQFSKCSPDVKCTLFKAFCFNMYVSTLWYNCTVTAMKRRRIAYKKSLRRLFCFNMYCSTCTLWYNCTVTAMKRQE